MSANGTPGPRSLRLLFVMRSPVFARNFEFTLRELLRRGHRVHVAFEREKEGLAEQRVVIERLEAEHPGLLTHGDAPAPTGGWQLAHRALRSSIDALRYFEPEYADAHKLRARALKHAPAPLRAAVRIGRLDRRTRGRRSLERALHRLDERLPAGRPITRFLAGQQPDAALVTPLVHFGSPQPDYVRAARRRGLPTGLLVFSWDNLTNKGVMHVAPDLIAVWNAEQRREALEHEGVRPEAVAVTGSAAYDHWFSWEPARDREAFCRQVGLDPQRPYLLYACSSGFIAPDEPEFVRDWLAAVRAHPRLRDVGVLVRPHPLNSKVWRGVELGDPHAVLHPRAGADPVDVSARQDYFDSLFHSVAVVGINTTALVESAIVGRETYSVRDPRFADTQDGTRHFAHLRSEHGGPLTVADGLDAHLEDLARAVEGEQRVDLQAFVERFVRPNGLDQPVAPLVADAVERLAGAGAKAQSSLGRTAPERSSS